MKPICLKSGGKCVGSHPMICLSHGCNFELGGGEMKTHAPAAECVSGRGARRNQKVAGSTPARPTKNKQNGLVRLLVEGVTEKHGQAWDLICLADGIGLITVDPFVSCACPVGTDADRRAMIGKHYVMADFHVHADGCYLPEIFCNIDGLKTIDDVCGKPHGSFKEFIERTKNS